MCKIWVNFTHILLQMTSIWCYIYQYDIIWDPLSIKSIKYNAMSMIREWSYSCDRLYLLHFQFIRFACLRFSRFYDLRVTTSLHPCHRQSQPSYRFCLLINVLKPNLNTIFIQSVLRILCDIVLNSSISLTFCNMLHTFVYC